MQFISVLKELKKISENENLSKEIAAEAVAMIASLFMEMNDYSIRLETMGREVFYYSTLPEDEALYWNCPLNIAKTERSAEKENSYLIHLPKIGCYEGFLVLEGLEKTKLNEEQENLLWLLQLFLCICLLGDTAEKNVFLDPITGFYGEEVFKRDLKNKLETELEGYMIAVRVPMYSDGPFSEDSMNMAIRKLAEICRQKEEKYCYRIAGDLIVILADGDKGKAIDKMQEIMQNIPETSILFLPYAKVNPKNIFTRIQKEIIGMHPGKIALETNNPYPRLSIFMEE